MGVSKVEVCGPNMQNKRYSQTTHCYLFLVDSPPNLFWWWFWLVGGESKWASWRDASDHDPKMTKALRPEGGQCIIIPNSFLCYLQCILGGGAVSALNYPRHQDWPCDWCGLQMWAGALWSIPCLFPLPGSWNEESTWSRATAGLQAPTKWAKQTFIV